MCRTIFGTETWDELEGVISKPEAEEKLERNRNDMNTRVKSKREKSLEDCYEKKQLSPQNWTGYGVDGDYVVASIIQCFFYVSLTNVGSEMNYIAVCVKLLKKRVYWI